MLSLAAPTWNVAGCGAAAAGAASARQASTAAGSDRRMPPQRRGAAKPALRGRGCLRLLGLLQPAPRHEAVGEQQHGLVRRSIEALLGVGRVDGAVAIDLE